MGIAIANEGAPRAARVVRVRVIVGCERWGGGKGGGGGGEEIWNRQSETTAVRERVRVEIEIETRTSRETTEKITSLKLVEQREKFSLTPSSLAEYCAQSVACETSI